MLDIAFIRQNPDVVRAAITNKRVDLDLDRLLAADKVRRETIKEIEAKRARKNEVAQRAPKASKEDRPVLVEEGKKVKAEIERLEPVLSGVSRRQEDQVDIGPLEPSGPNPPAEVEPVEAGHHPVRDHHMGVLGLQVFPGLHAISEGCDIEVQSFQGPA